MSNDPQQTTDLILAEITALYERNGEITKAGGFFTQEQIDNEKKMSALRVQLRNLPLAD